MVSSEAVPFSKSGGLADVASSLSIALSALDNDVRLVIPGYGSTDDSLFTSLPHMAEIPIGGKTERVRFKQLEDQGITVYLVDHPWFSGRKGIYGKTSYTPYGDNLLRFTLFSKAALALCKALDWIPEIVHGHDWTTGFLPSLTKSEKAFQNSIVVFTIHNLAYQGVFPRLDLLLSAMPIDQTLLEGKGTDQRTNMLKAAIENADILTTVSPTYAKEIQEVEQGCNLNTLLHSRADRLFGILNGIDTVEWDPSGDRLLDTHFSIEDLSGKAVLKEKMQKRFGLPLKKDVPVISMISRIADQKGFVELLQGMPCALEQIVTDFSVQILIIGTGEKTLEDKLMALAELHDNLSVNLIFSNEAAHLVEAGSDFFLMPSRYEPCGLNQMYSLRYGTIPIARQTGGLTDSVIDIDEGEGTGFLFKTMSGTAIYEAVERAITLYASDPATISSIRKRGMAVDFSWRNSAEEYMTVYRYVKEG